MLRIDHVTNDSRQRRTLILEDGSSVTFTMYFMPMQKGWFITELVHNDFVLKNIRITNNLNILHQYKNLIPFGMACISDEDREPLLQDDFLSEASKLYILTSDEVEEYSRFMRGEI